MAICTMTQALKKLYKAVVGEDTTKNNPTKIVSDLADNYSGGEGSGVGGGTLVVGVARVEGTPPNMNVILDKTWKEVNDAIARGERVVVVISNSDPYDYANSTIILNTMGNNTFVAYGISAEGGTVTPLNYYARSQDGYLQTQEIA